HTSLLHFPTLRSSDLFTMASSFNSSCIKLLLQAKFHRWRLRVRSTPSANAKPPAFDLRKPGQDDSPQLVDGVLQIIIDYLIIILDRKSTRLNSSHVAI